MADNPNVGPEPVEAKPNHVREKTYKAPKTPEAYQDELKDLPEKTTKDKVRDERATDAVKSKL